MHSDRRDKERGDRKDCYAERSDISHKICGFSGGAQPCARKAIVANTVVSAFAGAPVGTNGAERDGLIGHIDKFDDIDEYRNSDYPAAHAQQTDRQDACRGECKPDGRWMASRTCVMNSLA